MSTTGHSTAALDRLAIDVLNCLADDVENLEQIYRGVCYQIVSSGPPPTTFEYRPLPDAPRLLEIVECLQELISRGMVVPKMDDEGRPWTEGNDSSVLWKAWFELTEAGHAEIEKDA